MKHKLALYATIAAFAVSLAGCGSCTLYQRHDVSAGDFYLAEVCHEGTPQQTVTLLCTSKTRLKVGARDCKQ